MQLVSKFYAAAVRQKSHKLGLFRLLSKEQARGVVRAAAQRERLLHPSAAKSLQRLKRKSLVKLYLKRFGEDEFCHSLLTKRFERCATRFWLPGGFAHWKQRVLGKQPKRPFK